ncbi:MAG: SDR family NAD(P)-dependent oxidoreductase [Candidatus Puniceispirillales bacterium]
MTLPQFRVDGQIALVTGASSGLGLRFAELLVAAGAVVGIAARREDKLAAVAARLGDSAIPIPMDVTDDAAIARGFDQLEAKAGGCASIIVNNAGMADPTGFLDAERAATEAVFATNQMAVFAVAQQAAQRMIKAGIGGSIINIASIAGLRTIGGAASYAASKAAVAHLTKVQALECARHGIRVNALAPGYITTDINAGFLASPAGEKLIKRIPMQRCGTPEDLDGALLLLASDAGAFMTGVVLPVDGGHLTSTL